MIKDVKQIQLIVCDADNTLIASGHTEMGEQTKIALQKALEKGIKVLVNTGRHYTFVQKHFFETLPMEYIGTINGACLTDRSGKTIVKFPMSQDQMDRITNACIKNGVGLGYKFESGVVTYANHERFVDSYIQNGEDKDKLVYNNTDKKDYHLSHGLPLGIFLICDEKEMEVIQAECDDLVFAYSYRGGYDVFLKDINKATSTEKVLELYGLTWDNVIAFGDAGNDTPMIEKAYIGVAMGNSKDDVKEKADIVADTCLNDGVGKTLEELGII